jgi:hypothetical protein
MYRAYCVRGRWLDGRWLRQRLTPGVLALISPSAAVAGSEPEEEHRRDALGNREAGDEGVGTFARGEEEMHQTGAEQHHSRDLYRQPATGRCTARGRFRGEPEPELPAQQAHDPGDCIDGPCCVDEGHRPHECGRGDGGVPPDAQRHVPNEQGCHGQWHEVGEVTLKIIGDGSTWEYEDDHRDDEMESHHRADPVVRHADRVREALPPRQPPEQPGVNCGEA